MKRILSITLICLMAVVAWADVSFEAKIQGGNTVEAGSRFQIEFELGASSDDFKCSIGESGLRVIGGPFSSSYMSTSFVNGKSTVIHRTTYTYVAIADKEGTYTIPAAQASAGGKTYTSNSLTVKVLPADPSHQQQSQSQTSNRRQNSNASSNGVDKDDILLAMDLSKTTLYEGEAMVATLKLYFRNNTVVSIDDVKFPDLEGFTVQEMDLGENVQASIEQYKGGNYRAYPVRRWLLFPQRSGDVTIKSGSLSAIVQVYTGRRSFWDDPFSSYQNVKVPVTSPERMVSVKALPSGKPTSYMNAVGEFGIKAELTSNQIKANDAVIYRLTIEGTGNLKYVREPQPEFPADFEVYDPKSELQSRATTGGLTGRKTIEYTIIPRFGGSFTIPPVDFSYFNTKTGRYETLHSDAFTLEVEKGANEGSVGSGSVDYSGTTQERIKVLGSDIRYIHKIDADDLEKENEPLFGSLAYWLWFLIPALLFATLLIVYRRELKLRADTVGQRTRKANKVATRRLKAAAAALSQRKETEFYESVHKAMMGYVADKLSIPMSELTGDSIREELAKRQVDEETIKRCADVLSTCEFARYAPSADDQAMDKLYEEASSTIDSLEKAL